MTSVPNGTGPKRGSGVEGLRDTHTRALLSILRFLVAHTVSPDLVRRCYGGFSGRVRSREGIRECSDPFPPKAADREGSAPGWERVRWALKTTAGCKSCEFEVG